MIRSTHHQPAVSFFPTWQQRRTSISATIAAPCGLPPEYLRKLACADCANAAANLSGPWLIPPHSRHLGRPAGRSSDRACITSQCALRGAPKEKPGRSPVCVDQPTCHSRQGAAGALVGGAAGASGVLGASDWLQPETNTMLTTANNARTDVIFFIRLKSPQTSVCGQVHCYRSCETIGLGQSGSDQGLSGFYSDICCLGWGSQRQKPRSRQARNYG